MSMEEIYQSQLIKYNTELAQHEHSRNQEAGSFIQKDDILNLRISLETMSVDEFLRLQNA